MLSSHGRLHQVQQVIINPASDEALFNVLSSCANKEDVKVRTAVQHPATARYCTQQQQQHHVTYLGSYIAQLMHAVGFAAHTVLLAPVHAEGVPVAFNIQHALQTLYVLLP